MAKKIILTEEELKKINLDGAIRDIEKKISYDIIPKNPTRFFNIGEKIIFGGHNEVYIRESYRDGLYYAIECINVKQSSDKPAANETHVIEWNYLYKYGISQSTSFSKEEKYYIRQHNSGLSSLLHQVYHSGVDFDVEYQREHVWKIEDKIALIDSIFNNIDIGKFVFVQRDFSYDGKLYEIIDGKQRLTTLCEFYEDRFKYNEFYYSELSSTDKHKFNTFSITYGHLENPTKEAIYETFIKLNTCGKPMNSKHIINVKKLLSEL